MIRKLDDDEIEAARRLTVRTTPQWLIGMFFVDANSRTIIRAEAVFEASDLEAGPVTYVACWESNGAISITPLSNLLDGGWFETETAATVFLDGLRG